METRSIHSSRIFIQYIPKVRFRQWDLLITHYHLSIRQKKTASFRHEINIFPSVRQFYIVSSLHNLWPLSVVTFNCDHKKQIRNFNLQTLQSSEILVKNNKQFTVTT